MSYRIAVRELCEFSAKHGDLDLRFTPAPTAEEGMAGHLSVSKQRTGDYRSEVALSGTHGALTVRGRCDGYDADRQRVEEIKTYRGELAAMPDNHRQLHWAQARVYACLLCRQLGLPAIQVGLVYYHVDRQHETLLLEDWQADGLEQFFGSLCDRFLAWAEAQLRHRAERDTYLTDLAFPFGALHAGQRQLAESVYRGARLGRPLLAEAPTGVGKTLGTLFPLLKAMPASGHDKIYFLSAKTPGRQLALDALSKLRQEGTPLRVLELTARDKACVHPDRACHGEACPLARGFYDRLPVARAAAVEHGLLDRSTLQAVAQTHAVCPYYLSQDLVRWVDVVVGDYNYYFDFTALLHGLRVANEWRVGVLVDEAHNLVDRGRAMYSAELDSSHLVALRQRKLPELKGPLQKLARAWRQFEAAQQTPYQAYAEPPGSLLAVLQQAGKAIIDYLNAQPMVLDAPLLRFYFDLTHFLRLAESFGPHSVFDQSNRPGGKGRKHSTICLRNFVPAPFLGPRLASAHSYVLFSATLSPADYYCGMLGMPTDTPRLTVESPFRAEQLTVHLISQVSTRYRDRDASRQPIATLIARQYRQLPGNYLAFFSSFDYLKEIADELAKQAVEIPQWRQSRQMDELARAAFLERFRLSSQGIGFAVLGGAFAEGVDLPGEQLIGAFVATLGLPQFNPVNEQRRECLHALFGRGQDYAYLYPGLQKVVQAAGRVIRSPTDRGVLYLIDDRYADPKVRRLLPGWWHVETDGAGQG
ncbi:ATP-dependent DNA helicase [Chitinimonas arctica]|uniref:ATP-dependent DNA helicase n=1 Tax=Chitinimonas arctica TaxID=2594795 RepID=A0A516SHP1_9NEIS|nr:ATP-dependent DNA helicase [Chitinimonas arctica]QDQ27672.1 ATP-dependent DNA helicase [Chitinimonas arctica]